jgi:hypothetical protein
MPKLQLIRDKETPRTPERVAVAAAIDRHNKAVREVEAANSAFEAVRWGRVNGEEAVERAAAAVEEAKANAAQYLTDIALGTAGTAPLSIKDARAAHQAAIDDYEAAVAARIAVEKHRQGAALTLSLARLHLDECIRAVVKAEPAVRDAIAVYIRIKSDLANRWRTIAWLEKNMMVPPDLKNRGANINLVPSDQNGAEWEGFVKALETDPDAVLTERMESPE